MKKLLYNDVKQFIEENSECKLISTEYINCSEKLNLLCACGKPFKMSFKVFKSNSQRQCKDCSIEQQSKKLTKTHEKFLKQVDDLVGSEYSVLSEYKKYHEHVQMKHNKCGHEYPVTPANFITGYRCPNCYGVRKENTESFKIRIYEKYKDEYSVLGEYKRSSIKIKIKHNVCGHEYMVRPNDILEDSKCPRCYGNERKNIEMIKEEVYKLVKDEYSVSGNYKSNKTKLNFKHAICGCTFHMSSNNFVNGQRCPICNESKGEQSIRHIFEDNKVIFDTQYTYDDLLSDLGNSLRFDFIVFKDKEKVNIDCLIEYDGEFHFKSIEKYKGEPKEFAEERFRVQQYHDRLKDTYCNKNNIRLIRIPYWEFDNIQEILDKELNLKLNTQSPKAS